MSTNLLSSPIANTADHSHTTELEAVRLAMSEMGTGIKKTALKCGWRISDAGRNRVAEPLGPYPQMAHEIIDAGGAYHFVAKPLSVMLAHIRRRCSNKLPDDLKSALQSVKKECDDAESMGLSIAFSVSHPDGSALAIFVKESDEAILALEKAREIAEDKLAEER